MDNSLSIFDIEGITDDVNRINSSCQDARMRFLFKSLVTHLHGFVRETHLSTKEWEQAIKFLTDVGHMTSEVRQEFILLSDILGVSVLVDAIDHPKPPGATEGTILGPFHTHEAQQCHNGASISQDNEGQEMFVVCSVKDTQGQPIAGVKIDVWETNSKGFYDVQYPEREGPDGRAILTSDENGIFHFKAVVPASYPIPTDGPVGQLLTKLNRHPYRPSHIHFMFDKVGYDRLITALYIRGDPYETSDTVFGVKDSLIVELQDVSKGSHVDEFDVSSSAKLLQYDFVLVKEEDVKKLRSTQNL